MKYTYSKISGGIETVMEYGPFTLNNMYDINVA